MNDLEQFILDNDRVWPFPTYEAAWTSGCGFAEDSVTKEKFDKRIAEENLPSFSDHPDAKCFACDRNGEWYKNTLTAEIYIEGVAWSCKKPCHAKGWGSLQEGKPIGSWKDSLMIRQKQFTKDDLKDGMKLDFRNSDARYVLQKTTLIRSFHGWINGVPLSEFYVDLTHHSRPQLDIVKVTHMGELLWERPAHKPTPTEREVFISKFNKWVPGFFSDEYINEIYDKGFRYMEQKA